MSNIEKHMMQSINHVSISFSTYLQRLTFHMLSSLMQLTSFLVCRVVFSRQLFSSNFLDIMTR